MMIAPVVSKIFSWKYIWRHLYTYFLVSWFRIQITHMTPLIVMCSPQAELHLPPNICGCAASAEPSRRGSWCPLSYPETTVCFVANVSIMFSIKFRYFLSKFRDWPCVFGLPNGWHGLCSCQQRKGLLQATVEEIVNKSANLNWKILIKIYITKSSSNAWKEIENKMKSGSEKDGYNVLPNIEKMFLTASLHIRYDHKLFMRYGNKHNGKSIL